jgi:hypothetical protein
MPPVYEGVIVNTAALAEAVVGLTPHLTALLGEVA